MVLLKHAAMSDRGRVRRRNEDRWFADPEQQFYLVSDGIGGHLFGEAASEAVVQTLPKRLRKALGRARSFSSSVAAEKIAAVVSDLSEDIRKESEDKPGLRGMGATVVLAAIRGEQAIIVHLGDSRAYLHRDDGLTQLTKDHNLAQLLVDAGEIPQDDVRGHPAGGGLSRYVGMEGTAPPESRIVDLHSGDRLLLCTDGLSGAVDAEKLRSILRQERDLAEACRRLVQAANESGGKDNITVLLVAVD